MVAAWQVRVAAAAAAELARLAARWALLTLQQALQQAPQALALLQQAGCLRAVEAAVAAVVGSQLSPARAGAAVHPECSVLLLHLSCGQHEGSLELKSRSCAWQCSAAGVLSLQCSFQASCSHHSERMAVNTSSNAASVLEVVAILVLQCASICAS